MLLFDYFLSIFFSGQIEFYNEFFPGNMALLIRSYHGKMNTMARSWQDLDKILAKIVPRS